MVEYYSAREPAQASELQRRALRQSAKYAETHMMVPSGPNCGAPRPGWVIRSLREETPQHMKYARTAAWIFLLAGSVVIGLAAQIAPPPSDPGSAVIRYEDGFEVTITNWSFLYTYDYDVDARHYSR